MPHASTSTDEGAPPSANSSASENIVAARDGSCASVHRTARRRHPSIAISSAAASTVAALSASTRATAACDGAGNRLAVRVA